VKPENALMKKIPVDFVVYCGIKLTTANSELALNFTDLLGFAYISIVSSSPIKLLEKINWSEDDGKPVLTETSLPVEAL